MFASMPSCVFVLMDNFEVFLYQKASYMSGKVINLRLIAIFPPLSVEKVSSGGNPSNSSGLAETNIYSHKTNQSDIFRR